jgi:hypothetical protein
MAAVGLHSGAASGQFLGSFLQILSFARLELGSVQVRWVRSSSFYYIRRHGFPSWAGVFLGSFLQFTKRTLEVFRGWAGFCLGSFLQNSSSLDWLGFSIPFVGFVPAISC